METITVFFAIIIGTGVFFLLNQVMDITYLGCGAIGSFWLGCVLFSGLGVMLLGQFLFGFLFGLLKLIIIIAIIGFVVSKVNSNQE
ncbi:hypothetical protein [Romboutsia timonensis]|uniref:hypothetical protein n=1 Tax=Romboutsia timonensis TaxID=1776391 RepID=UPI00399431CB